MSQPSLEKSPVFAAIPGLSSTVFAGGGEMGALMRSFDWSQTSLGPVELWPQSLRTAVSIILNSRYPMFIWWGRELTNLYNDPYRAFLGVKHPAALGQSARDVWAEIWDQIGPRTNAVLLRGESTFDEALLLLMARHGYLEETYFTFSYSPIPVENGDIGGIFCAVTEETQKIVGERRLKLLREVAAATAEPRNPLEVCQAAARCLSHARRDLPFSLIYLLDQDCATLTRVAEAGIDPRHPAAVESVSLRDPDSCPWPIRKVVETGETVLLSDLGNRFSGIPRGEWNQPPDSAVLLPIARQGQARPAGVLVAGLNPHRKFTEQYRGFVSILSSQIAGALANAHAWEAERRRAEQLAELDRAKTAFFSNVSHEFRTPLTLMLGPLEDVLARSREHLPPEDQEQLAVVRRNSLRLLKLVNSLLDFSRIEAGRVQAVYELTDICTFTAEVASVFRSAMEKAGLRFTVACDPIAEPVYIDREMWEKIVLNLLSNAFKFTFTGEVALTLRAIQDQVEMSVRDTGSGIPADELLCVFDRFHRVENSRARTHEGTGIGLALVQELARLHGGSVRAESAPGQGSTFTVVIPCGRDHLPADRIGIRPAHPPPPIGGEGWIEEAQRWLPAEFAASATESGVGLLPSLPSISAVPSPQHQDLVLIADDNADMREYLTRLLRPAYRIHAVADGLEALRAARELHPALVLTDVMMPGLDGFGVLGAIRSDLALAGTPVLLLSARAGEESRVEGLEAGADDYLVKPFTARELLARVSAHINLAVLRREAAATEARLRAEADLERRRLREVLAQAPAAIGLLHGPEHRWVYVNDTYVSATGRRSASDLLGKTVREALPELEGQGFYELLDQVFRTGAPYIGREARVLLNRGERSEPRETWFDFVYQPMLNTAGEVEGILVHAVDVTDRVETRRLVEANHERLRLAHVASQRLAAIVECSDDAIVSTDLSGLVATWNPCAERTFGYTAAEIIGRPITTITPPELHPDEKRILASLARGESTEHFETVRLTKSGERIDVSLTISPLRDEIGKIVGASRIARDITQRKKAERILHTTERLAAVGRLAATVAHEINNPLEAVTNLVFLASQSAEDESVRGYLAAADEELSRIALLTRQTLGFYRETRGISPLRLEPLVTPLVAAFQSRARNKSVTIEIQVRQDREIYGIPGEIRQIIANLLSNSIDAVPSRGRIRLRISSAAERTGRCRSGTRFTIADNGSGIPAEYRQRLFEPFFTTKQEIGTGLGLWVCRSIVEKHGGAIRLRSSTTPGCSGTAFSVFLPSGSPTTLETDLPLAS